MDDRVCSDLADGKHEVVGGADSEVRGPGLSGNQLAQSCKGATLKHHRGDVRLRLGQRLGERRLHLLLRSATVTFALVAVQPQPRVAAMCFLEHIVGKRTVSYGQEQMKARPISEGEVEKRLMTLALDQLRRATVGPNRLPDTADHTTSVFVRELAPCRDDAARIGSHLRHIGEADDAGLADERVPQRLDLGGGQHGQRRLPRLGRLPQERGSPSRNSSSSA